MIPKVKISQFGRRFKVIVDGRVVSFEKLIILCNCGPVKLRRILNHENRENLVVEAILKARYGVSFASTTYWKGIVPMWIPLVVEKTGICKVAAAGRIHDWLNGGTYGRMMRPKYLQVM